MIVIRIVAAIEEAAMMMEMRKAVAAKVTEPATAEMRDACAVPSSASAKTCASKVTATDVSAAHMTATEAMTPAAPAEAMTPAAAAAAMAAADLNQIIGRRLR
jgi:hypothetical protein